MTPSGEQHQYLRPVVGRDARLRRPRTLLGWRWRRDEPGRPLADPVFTWRCCLIGLARGSCFAALAGAFLVATRRLTAATDAVDTRIRGGRMTRGVVASTPQTQHVSGPSTARERKTDWACPRRGAVPRN